MDPRTALAATAALLLPLGAAGPQPPPPPGAVWRGAATALLLSEPKLIAETLSSEMS